MFFVMHILNFIFSALALCGLEKKFCISYVLLALVIFDLVVLGWSQATYFKSQSYNCNLEMPSIYFWLMSEILFFYCLTAFIMCYFFRRFCQDPSLRQQIEEEDKAEEEADAAEAEAAAAGKKEGAAGAKDAKKAGKANMDNVPTDDGADDEAPAKPNKTKKAEVAPKK